MSETRAALASLSHAVEALASRPRLPPASAIAVAAELLFERASLDPLPSADRLEELRRSLMHVCQSGAVQSLPGAELRDAPMVFWDREPQAAAFPGLLDAFLREATERTRLLRVLIEAWLRDFDRAAVRLPEVGERVARLLASATDPRLRPWRLAHERYQLFDAAQGPLRVAGTLLRGPEPVERVLSETGMDHPLRSAGKYFCAVLRATMGEMPKALSEPGAAEAWRRTAGLLHVETPTRDRQFREVRGTALRFEPLRRDVIAGSLTAFARGAAHPSAPRQDIKSLLLRVIGDPRLAAAKWSDAPEDCSRLLRAWLTEESLEVFFRLIDQTNSDRAWRYRRAFWRACLRKMPQERPGEAWVVLGPNLAMRARATAGLSDSFGLLEGSGGNKDQAVLLLRFGDIVLSEWSNVGALRAWDTRRTLRCPRLYEKSYDAADLRAHSLDFPDNPVTGKGGARGGRGLYHFSPESGMWQGCAAMFLRNHVGLQLSPSDYMDMTR